MSRYSRLIFAAQPSAAVAAPCLSFAVQRGVTTQRQKTFSQDKKIKKQNPGTNTEIAREKAKLGACFKKAGGTASSREF